MARPWTAIVGVSAVLLLLASPLLSLETGTEAIAQFPKDSDVRVGNELASEQLGGGTDPVQIVAGFDGPAAARTEPPSSASCGELAGHAGSQPRSPLPAYARRQRPDPGDPERAERVRRRGGAGRPPARHRRPRLGPGAAGRSQRRRRDRPRRRRPRPGQRLDVEDHPLRPRAQLPRPDGDAALADPAAEGGADEPALDRRGLRRPRRDLPVGLARRLPRLRKPGGAGHDQRAADLRRSSSASRWTTRCS